MILSLMSLEIGVAERSGRQSTDFIQGNFTGLIKGFNEGLFLELVFLEAFFIVS